MENLTSLLENLAVKLGTTVEYLWTVLIQQAAIEGIFGIIFIAVMILLIIPVVIYSKWVLKNWNDLYKKDTEVGHLATSVALGFFTGTLFIISIVNLGNIITAFINPEYWALQEVLNYLN